MIPTIIQLDISVVAERMQHAMAAAEFSQRDVARQSGVSPAQVWKLLRQQRPQVQADTLMRLAQALGVTLDWLVGLSEEMRPRMREARR